MPDTENSGRSSCPPVAYKRSIRKKRQIARERAFWETNDRDVLLAKAVGCRKLNAAFKDNQEVEFALASRATVSSGRNVSSEPSRFRISKIFAHDASAAIEFFLGELS